MDTTADGYLDSGRLDNLRERFPYRKNSVEMAVSSEDEILVTAAAGGDDEAFCRLVEKHQERIYHFCFQWLRQSEDAREACQDTFVRVYQSLGKYRSQGRFTSWLLRIALNQCRDRYRSKGAQQQRNTDPLPVIQPELICQNSGPDDLAAIATDLEMLWLGIDQLPTKLREVLILCAVEGVSQEETASIIGCSIRAVEGRLYRARKTLEAWWKSQRG
ncbi:MAG: RNA polymerase sigma factor [Verrucomicrobiae bacterium]|nr:RNA polymerase sigma factor [Verrucomicrobiae bacterium]